MVLLVVLGIFVVGLVIGVPIAFAVGIAALAGYLAFDPALLILVPQRMYSGVDSFQLMAVPFFILAGDLMGTSGILRRLIRFAETLVGHLRGGIAQVNIVASMIFSGISGSAVADASALGTALIPTMTERYGNRSFAAAVCAAAASMGPIIPPSIPMVIYAFTVGHISIGGMFLAGVVPGILMGAGMMVIVYVIARRRGYDPAGLRATPQQIGRAFLEATWALVMPAIILGGTLGGVFTATESAAVAVAYAVVVGALITRELRWAHVLQALERCVLISAVVFFLVATSEVVTWLLSATGLPVALAEALRSVSTDPRIFLLLVNVFLLVAGTILEPVPLIIMVAPILAPIAASYGIDPLHFGFVFVLNVVIGLMTPPVGGILFTVCGIARAPIERVSVESMPFLLWLAAVLLLVTYAPWIAMGLPNAFGY